MILQAFSKALFFCICIFLMQSTNARQAEKYSDSDAKAALISIILNHIHHSDFDITDTLTMGFMGEDKALFQSLKKLEAPSQGEKPVKVLQLKPGKLPEKINLLLVCNENNSQLTSINSIIGKRNVLLITDQASHIELSMLNFIYRSDETLDFELNYSRLKALGFKVSATLVCRGGTNADLLGLYEESEQFLQAEKKISLALQTELNRKTQEISELKERQKELLIRIDSLNHIIQFQIGNIHDQHNILRELNSQLAILSSQARVSQQKLDSINLALSIKNVQISTLDIDLAKKQSELVNTEKSLNLLMSLIQEKEKKLKLQSSKIQSQGTALFIFLAFIVVLLVLILLVYRNYKTKTIRNIDLELRNQQIILQKERIEFQAEELQMKNLELEKLSIVAEKTDNAVLILNKHGNIEWANNAFERLQGRKLYEFIEEKGKNFLRASNSPNAREIFANCLKSKKPVNYNSYVETEAGKVKWLQSTLTPILNEAGEITKIIAIDSDISKLKEAELDIINKNRLIEEKAMVLSQQTEALTNANSELEKQRNRAEKALKKLQETQTKLIASEKMASLGQLTAGIAHEINNPVNFISSSIEGLRDILEDFHFLMSFYEKQADRLDQGELNRIKEKIGYNELLLGFDELTGNIKMGVDRTREIVASLRTFSRIDDNYFSDTDLHKNIESAIVLLGRSHKDRIEIIKNFGEIPLIPCIAGKINQVILNILMNAVQAIENEGKIEISTRMTSRKLIDLVQVDFIDTGKGMTQAVIDRIYEPFFTTKEVGSGTGLGLSIVYSIIQMHKGSIEVTSKPGVGTSFSLFLPIIQKSNTPKNSE